ncbi:hypothetical protein WK95_05905 [Burkholderia ubonensis]|nr:hypothetical protein WK95_05905 [Burkholderia ubonensis]
MAKGLRAGTALQRKLALYRLAGVNNTSVHTLSQTSQQFPLRDLFGFRQFPPQHVILGFQ